MSETETVANPLPRERQVEARSWIGACTGSSDSKKSSRTTVHRTERRSGWNGDLVAGIPEGADRRNDGVLCALARQRAGWVPTPGRLAADLDVVGKEASHRAIGEDRLARVNETRCIDEGIFAGTQDSELEDGADA